jgi:hypothetical protein
MHVSLKNMFNIGKIHIDELTIVEHTVHCKSFTVYLHTRFIHEYMLQKHFSLSSSGQPDKTVYQYFERINSAISDSENYFERSVRTFDKGSTLGPCTQKESDWIANYLLRREAFIAQQDCTLSIYEKNPHYGLWGVIFD